MSAAYGIIGYPLTHPSSPKYFAEKFLREGIDATYKAYPLRSIDELPAWLAAHPELLGFNITIPYKTSIIPFLQYRDGDVAEMGACNCVKITQSGLAGYNTDWTGFYESLKPLLQPQHTQALVLGSGGAAKAVCYALRQLGIPFKIVSRAGGGMLDYGSLTPEIIAQHRLIINTTPLGMSPDEDAAPDIPYQWLTPEHLLYDVIHTPAETLFLKKGKAAGAQTKNGQEMLALQAERNWAIWNAAA